MIVNSRTKWQPCFRFFIAMTLLKVRLVIDLQTKDTKFNGLLKFIWNRENFGPRLQLFMRSIPLKWLQLLFQTKRCIIPNYQISISRALLQISWNHQTFISINLIGEHGSNDAAKVLYTTSILRHISISKLQYGRT